MTKTTGPFSLRLGARQHQYRGQRHLPRPGRARLPSFPPPAATERNQALAANCTSASAEVSCEPVDLLATQPLQPQLSEVFDLYLVTAGYLGDAERARNDAAEAQAITQANFTGLIPWLTAIMSAERIQHHGALWVFSSVAADRGRLG